MEPLKAGDVVLSAGLGPCETCPFRDKCREAKEEVLKTHSHIGEDALKYVAEALDRTCPAYEAFLDAFDRVGRGAYFTYEMKRKVEAARALGAEEPKGEDHGTHEE